MGTDGKELALNVPLGTLALLGRDYLNHAETQDYVKWAVNKLVKGGDSHSLKILAGLEKPLNIFEVKHFFDRALKELGIESKPKDQLIEHYALEVTQYMVEGTLSAEHGLAILSQICLDTDYDEKYLSWYLIESARQSIAEGEYPWSFERLYDANFDQVVAEESLNFLMSLEERKED